MYLLLYKHVVAVVVVVVFVMQEVICALTTV